MNERIISIDSLQLMNASLQSLVNNLKSEAFVNNLKSKNVFHIFLNILVNICN